MHEQSIRTVVVTGASGLLGRAVMAALQEQQQRLGIRVIGTAFSRSTGDLVKLDLTDVAETERFLFELKPSAIIHCAAERRPDVAERDRDGVLRLNVETSGALARIAKDINAWLLYISTDYVFDGTQPPYEVTATPNPLNFYGLSKQQGEVAVAAANSDAAILRVPVLYGHTHYFAESAVNILLDLVISSKPAKMDHVQARFPTNVADVANVILQMLERVQDKDRAPRGIYHFSASEQMSKYDMCVRLGTIHGTDVGHITPVTVLPPGEAVATRPLNAQLSNSKLIQEGFDISHVKYDDWWKTHLNHELAVNQRQ
ncbi:uncharacterized protein BJ171DRAFT_509466 [Polychytrium aggregatum]|uniref:uncharacterized protein n=1 Tax=Polychytrium aggregatum TaxID=110093 RepID=UPI0022FEFEB5|nr:uncharacterized protein BJ171DRAFT_509466 [Polychytrium aggregatum]KAI9203740.1 hypothetical protein BJ171DRAFT_509466 [Polychytrium aggregatum]